MKSRRGVFVHVLIHLLVGILILAPIMINGYLWLIYVLLGINFLHFWIDEAKISYDLKHDKQVKSFLIDQLLHLLTILLAYFFVSHLLITLPNAQFYNIYTDIRIIGFASFLVFSSTVIEVFRFQSVREKHKKAKLRIKLEKILNRLIVFTLIYGLLTFLAFYASEIA